MQDQLTTADAGDPDITRTVTELLAGLGNTADAVADQLRARGIKGHRNDDCDCPIARLLLTLPGIEDVEVRRAVAFIYPSGNYGMAPMDLPKPVSHFTWLFDQGVFLDLVDMSAVA